MDEILDIYNPVISIIIPVYNVEKYIVRCLDSIFNQVFDYEFEVIAVDDCSTDDSLSILKEYKKKNFNFYIIKHETNKKLSVARKSGIDAARGEYIMHIDSDDWILPNTLNQLYKKCKETNADVVVFNYMRDIANIKVAEKLIDKEDFTVEKLVVQKYFYGSVWNKIVKKEFTNNMVYGQCSINSTEDLVYSTELLLRVNSICLFPKTFYIYSFNSESITATVDPIKYLQNQAVILKQINKIFQTYNSCDLLLENVLKYFEKWIYLEISKLHFKNNRNLFFDTDSFLKELSIISIISSKRIKLLKLAIDNKYYCLYQIFKRFRFRILMSITFNFYFKNSKS